MTTESDRELLELAAKAAGIRHPAYMERGHSAGINRGPAEPLWNPLTDDGDALRLAVKLDALIDQQAEGVFVCINAARAYASEPYGDDKYASTRRAIVRAAAAIARATHKEQT